jgi:hypothetical protein
MAFPTSVEPVNATLSTSAWETDGAAGVAGARHDVDHARRQVGLLADLGEEQRRQRRGLRGLEHDGVAGRQRGCDLPGELEQREVPGDHLAGDTQRFGSGPSPAQRACPPSRVVEEVARDERDVDVAGLADRLAVVEGVHDRRARARAPG